MPPVSDHTAVGRADDSVKATTRAPTRLAGLDGARGLACLSLLIGHVGVTFAPHVLTETRLDLILGHGVTFFFALSAFLLYLPYVKRLSTGRSMPETPTYLRHRVLRILPAYFVIFLIANFVMRAVYVQNPFVVGWGNGDRGTGLIVDPRILLANLTLTHTLFPATFQTGINPSWSLTTEWEFYLLLPLIGLGLFALTRAASRPMTVALLPPVILVATGVATNTVVKVLRDEYYPHSVLQGYWGSNWIAVLSRSFAGFAGVFGFGMLAAVIYVALINGKLKGVSTIRLQWIFAATMLLGIMAGTVLFALAPQYVETVMGFASAALTLLIVAPISRGEHSTIASILEWGPLNYFGVVSLSAYLWHFPVIILIQRLHLPIPSNALGLILATVAVTAVTVVFSMVTYRFVEKPMARRRR